ncbi:MAG TPA: hypothetical protein VMU13_00220 [Candidatus Paceibacterota bacterium]|nr:hypothetical protein [Candidatus Paceibacterota bacterium]
MRKSSATGSFLKFTFGFVTFLVVSFALTLGVSSITKTQDSQQAAAAALALMLK